MTLNRRTFVQGVSAAAALSASKLALAADTLKIGYVSPQTGPLAPFGERQRAQIGIALAKQIIGAQMDRIILCQLWRHHLAIEALLQNVKALHPAIAQHQQLAVDCAGHM